MRAVALLAALVGRGEIRAGRHSCPIFRRCRTLGMPAVIERFDALGVELRPSTSEELASFIREDLAKWRRVVRETGLKLE